MDLIYTSSVLTLIAAAGSDPSYGPPGVSNARKLRFLNTSIGNVYLSFTPENAHRAVAGSPWFTRGWTFQEGYVARRRLYFTESGILFVCNTAEEQEELWRHHGPAISIIEGTLNSRALKARNDGLEGIMRLLEQYMRRQLSYENDVLNAILGVLNYHHTRNPSIGTICGLPYQTSVAGPKIVCVNWTHSRPATRRLGYPSWSPFGWIGPVNFSPIEDQFHPSKEDAVSFSGHVRDGCADWNHIETPQYLQITVHIHHLPIVNIFRSDYPIPVNWLSEHTQTKTMLALPVGGMKLNYDDPNFYTDILWDQAPPDHYDSNWVTCAVLPNYHLASHLLMILQDHGTHYERVGLAMPCGTHLMTTIKAAGLDELASTTNGIPTLRRGEGTNSYVVPISPDEEDFIWLQFARKVIITLG
ncbi:hypothetical protein AA0112_g9094 [Alternaria arborescens]|nr:hypothetical protein AA0112_g9094 [Alternaria arborescens]